MWKRDLKQPGAKDLDLGVMVLRWRWHSAGWGQGPVMGKIMNMTMQFLVSEKWPINREEYILVRSVVFFPYSVLIAKIYYHLQLALEERFV